MRHLDLFAGIGGFSLAARWAGWQTVAWCEIDPSCQKVLSHHFPNAEKHGDIKQTDFSGYAGKIDVLTGGFPCQPYSSAGKRLGDGDNRSLWQEMLRAIGEIRPRWVVGENVVGITNLDGGETLRHIKHCLENIGYKVECFDIPAYCVGLQTLERHIWIVAKAVSIGRKRRKAKPYKNDGNKGQFSGAGSGEFERRDISQTRFCRVGERVSGKLDKYGRQRLKQLGNAINPQIALLIFNAINEYEQNEYEQQV